MNKIDEYERMRLETIDEYARLKSENDRELWHKNQIENHKKKYNIEQHHHENFKRMMNKHQPQKPSLWSVVWSFFTGNKKTAQRHDDAKAWKAMYYH